MGNYPNITEVFRSVFIHKTIHFPSISSGVWWIGWWMLMEVPNLEEVQSHGSRWKVDVRWTSLVDTIDTIARDFFSDWPNRRQEFAISQKNVTTNPIYTPCCWKIYQHLAHKSPSFVGKYTVHGAFGKWTLISIPTKYNWLVVWNIFDFP